MGLQIAIAQNLLILMNAMDDYFKNYLGIVTVTVVSLLR